MARAEKKIHYLYKTTCLITGRYYIGMHSAHNLDDGYMGSGKRLRYSIHKYGVDNHKKEILEFFETRELLVEAEINAITEDMVLDKNCMNLKQGGTGGFVDEKHKENLFKSIDKSRETYRNRLREDEDFRLKHIETYKKNFLNGLLSGKIKHDSFKNKKHTEESKQKMSEKRKGTGTGPSNSQFGTCWITKDGTNKKIKKEDLHLFLSEGWVKGRN